MSVRPRLLFLCQTLPYPPDGGVWIRTYHVLRLLARAFDVTALCFERAGSHGGARDIAASREALARFGAVEVFAIPQRHSRARFAWDHLRSTARRRVYTDYLYESAAFRARLTELVRTRRFDLVHADSLDMAGYFAACGDLPIVSVHHDVQSALLRRRAGIERRRWRRLYLRYQGRLTAKAERTWCARIALNVVVSERDAAALQRLVPEARVAVVPNGVDVDEFRPVPTPGAGVAYVGGTNWFPNLDALEFFCADILPRLRAAGVEAPARWIGSASDAQRTHYRQRHGVELSGYVDDVRPLMGDAACHVVPLRAGGGTRLKILNSWAMGKPIVSTSLGSEGLDAVDGENILIRDDPAGFADAILAVFRDEALRRRLGERGRLTAERRYSWDVIGETMLETYLRLAQPSRRAGIAAPRAAEATP